METGIVILLISIVAVLGIYYFFKTVKHLIVNTVLGLVILGLSKLFIVGIPITTTVILICAVGGIPGAVLVILLHVTGMGL